MLTLEQDAPTGSVLVFTPAYLEAVGRRVPFPHRLLPVIELLTRHAERVHFVDEAVTPVAPGRLGALAETCALVVIWLAETNPKRQIHGLRRALSEVVAVPGGPPVVAGGGYLQKWPGSHLTGYAGLSAVVRGHGGAVAEVLEAVRGRAPLAAVPGVLLPTGDCFGEDGLRAVEADGVLSSGLGLLERLDLTAHVESGGVFANGEPTLVLPGGRGCGGRCPFCWWFGQERTRSAPDELAEALVALRDRHGVRQFHIADLDFADDHDALCRFADELLGRGAGLAWGSNASPEDLAALSDADLDLLGRSGLRMLELGVETASARSLAWLGKRHSAEDARHGARRLAARGIANLHDFLFGLPDETEVEVERTLALVEELLDVSPLVYVVPRLYEAQAGTPRGDALYADHPGLPANIDALIAHRRRHPRCRTMPWLDARIERWVKDLVLYDLPLRRWGVPGCGGWSRWLGPWAVARAKRRRVTGTRMPRWERRLVESTLGRALVRAFDA